MDGLTVKLYSLEYKDVKTYQMAALFIMGNIIFPQLAHLVNMGQVLNCASVIKARKFVTQTA